LDWLFSPNTQIAGVGFNPVTVTTPSDSGGSTVVEIEVYSITDMLLGSATGEIGP
jgi:hypothetical protein